MGNQHEHVYGCSSQEEREKQTRIDFVTLGMLILDDIDFPPPRPSVKGILGGAGSYSALGARLMSPPPLSKTVGWVIDQGRDWPSELSSVLDSWGTSALVRHDPERLTTRGWNGYRDSSEQRAFSYITPKKRILAADITGELLLSSSFHLICSPSRARELITEITARRKAAVEPELYTRPMFIWEPVPDLCTPEELLNCTNTLPLVDICSPNHNELAGFMGDTGVDPETGEISTAAVEQACEQLLSSMPLQSYALVIRAGKKGCYIAKNSSRKRQRPAVSGVKRRSKYHGHRGLQPDTDMEALFAGLLQDEDGLIAREEIEVDPGIERWIPAYHASPDMVVDSTGAGNVFLGALGVAMARGQSLEEAAVCASVAASLAVEQVGMPILGRSSDDRETWNGVTVDDRLQAFQRDLACNEHTRPSERDLT